MPARRSSSAACCACPAITVATVRTVFGCSSAASERAQPSTSDRS